MQEIWRPVVGYEGWYEVSDQGRVRSLDRYRKGRSGCQRLVPGRILAGSTHPYGYPMVTLYGDGSDIRTRPMHSLVAEAFIGPRPEGMLVCHWDGNPKNNVPSNLRYGTASDNSADMIRHGRSFSAAKTHCPQGHEYTPENTIQTSRARRCRICRSEQQRRADTKRRAA